MNHFQDEIELHIYLNYKFEIQKICPISCISLYTLWHEYDFGIGSRKAAKHFDARDRGTNRYNYSKRKVFWDLVSLMVRRGRQANEAIEELYKYYRYKTSLTNILKAMRKERMEGSGFAQFFVS